MCSSRSVASAAETYETARRMLPPHDRLSIERPELQRGHHTYLFARSQMARAAICCSKEGSCCPQPASSQDVSAGASCRLAGCSCSGSPFPRASLEAHCCCTSSSFFVSFLLPFFPSHVQLHAALQKDLAAQSQPCRKAGVLEHHVGQHSAVALGHHKQA